MSKTSQHTNRAIIQQSKTNSRQICRRERGGGERERGREMGKEMEIGKEKETMSLGIGLNTVAEVSYL